MTISRSATKSAGVQQVLSCDRLKTCIHVETEIRSRDLFNSSGSGHGAMPGDLKKE
jgi:hypothetical protein